MVRSPIYKAKEEEGDMDRVSNLPEVLMHQILSYLDTKEAARTSVLSKTWLQSFSTIPILSFVEFDFKPDIWKVDIDTERDRAIKRTSFVNFVNKTLLRYKSLNLSIHKIYINSSLLEAPSTASLADNWIRLALDNGLQHLMITHYGFPYISPTPLPSIIFESPNRSLTHLTVSRSKFPQNVVTTSNSKCNGTIFPFLRELKLSQCYIDEKMLQKLLSVSPSLETVILWQSSGFKKFRVCNLRQLKTVEFCSAICQMEVDIENIHSLLSVKYELSSYMKMPFLLKVASAPNLKCLELKEVSIRDNQLRELVANLTRLEDLKLIRCWYLDRINITSHSLKRLCFLRWNNKVEVKIDAPKLLEFEYNGEHLLSLSLNNTPQEFIAHICLVSYYSKLNDLWIHKFKELLRSLNRARVSLYIHHLDIGFVTILDFGANPLPPEHQTENFMQEIDPSSSLFARIVNTLFSSSRPTTIARFDSFRFHDFSKFLCSELITTTRNLKCCGLDKIKCWRHFLKNIELEIYDDSLKVWQSLHPEALRSESTFPDKMIRFSLQWYDNLNGQA